MICDACLLNNDITCHTINIRYDQQFGIFYLFTFQFFEL